MKNLTLVFLIFVVAPVLLNHSLIAQTVPQTPSPQFDYDSAYTSAAQMKDLKPTDAYYPAVQNLLDKYEFIYAYDDGKFHAEQILTREQLAAFLDSGLNKLIDLAGNAPRSDQLGAGTDTLGCNGELPGAHTLFCSYSAENKKVNLLNSGIMHSFPVMVDSLSEVKDVKKTDAYFTRLQSLTELHRVNLIDPDKNFRASKAVTKKEFYDLLKAVFGYQPKTAATQTNEPLTRGEFVTAFNNALETAAGKTK